MYSVIVAAADHRGNAVAYQTVVIHLLDEDDNPPTVARVHADDITVAENSPVGTLVTRIEYRDLDEVT